MARNRTTTPVSGSHSTERPELEVTVRSGDGKAEVRRGDGRAPFTIGRSEDATVRLEGDLVSRHHAIISVHEGALRVEDSSSNGTLVGGTVLRRGTFDTTFGTPIVVGEFVVVIVPAERADAGVGDGPAR